MKNQFTRKKIPQFSFSFQNTGETNYSRTFIINDQTFSEVPLPRVWLSNNAGVLCWISSWGAEKSLQFWHLPTLTHVFPSPSFFFFCTRLICPSSVTAFYVMVQHCLGSICSAPKPSISSPSSSITHTKQKFPLCYNMAAIKRLLRV